MSGKVEIWFQITRNHDLADTVQVWLKTYNIEQSQKRYQAVVNLSENPSCLLAVVLRLI